MTLYLKQLRIGAKTTHQNAFRSVASRVKIGDTLQACFAEKTELFSESKILGRRLKRHRDARKFEVNIENFRQVVRAVFQGRILYGLDDI